MCHLRCPEFGVKYKYCEHPAANMSPSGYFKSLFLSKSASKRNDQPSQGSLHYYPRGCNRNHDHITFFIPCIISELLIFLQCAGTSGWCFCSTPNSRTSSWTGKLYVAPWQYLIVVVVIFWNVTRKWQGVCFQSPCYCLFLNHLVLCLTEGCKDGQKHGQAEAELATDKK